MDEFRNDELTHYGVKGMKWGVRKDARLMANHTRNQAVKDAKKQYKSGTISKAEKKAAIVKANATLKGSKKSTKNAYKATKTRAERTQFQKNVTSRAKSEVPHRKLKRAASFINSATTVAAISKSTISVGVAFAVGSPVMGATVAGHTALVAAQLGKQYLVQKGLDKLS